MSALKNNTKQWLWTHHSNFVCVLWRKMQASFFTTYVSIHPVAFCRKTKTLKVLVTTFLFLKYTSLRKYVNFYLHCGVRIKSREQIQYFSSVC